MQENKPESTVLIKQDIRVIKQTLFPSFLDICTAETKHFSRHSNQRQSVAANVSAVTALLTPPQVFLRLSRANKRPASCPFAFRTRKKSALVKIGDQRDGGGGKPIISGGGEKALSVLPAPNQCEEWS